MNKFMEIAKDNAIKGIRANEGGPFGAIIVDGNGKIVGKGNNKVLLNNDPTAHAEIVAIRDACNNLNTYDLTGCILYTSCEPCPMCLSAIIWANIKKVYYGCTKDDAATIGFRDSMIYDFIRGENKTLLNLEEMDRNECLEVFEEYSKNKGTIY